MIDESVDQSFPASDPPMSSQPGSLVWQRYAAKDAARGSPAIPPWLTFALCAAGAAFATILIARRIARPSDGELP